MKNPWKLTSLVLALALAFVVGLQAVGSARAAEKQPHMRSALGFLHAAKAELDKATPDKGGHRAKALELTAAAIAETEAGAKFDNAH
jgi:hypothetical protein